MNLSTLCTSLVTFGPETPEFTLSTVYHLLWRYGKNRPITSNSSEYLGRILTYFTGLVLVRMIISIFVWRSPKRRCYGNQWNLGHVRRHRQKRPLIFALAFNNGLADRKSAFKLLNGNIRATSCTNLVNFCPIFSDFTLLKRAIFAAICPQFDDYLHSSQWHSKTVWKIAILISAE